MVSKYERKRGYGFITPSAGGEDVFVRQGSIRMEGITFLVPGDQVRYELESTGNGTQAVAVALTAPRAEKKRSLPRLSDLPLPPLSSLLSPIALARALVRRPILLVVLAAVLALFAADWLGLSAGDRPKPTDPADDGSAGMLLTECGAVSAPALPSSVRDRPTASDVLAHAHGASLADLQDFLGKPDQILPSNHGIRWVALWWSACQLDNPGKHWPVAHVGVVFAGTVAGQPDQAHEVRTNIIGSHGLILRSDGP
jgi:cold shock CspA family protein